MTDIDPDILRKLLNYDPLTGFLTWKLRSVEFFADGPSRSKEHNAAAWNGRFAGKKAFNTMSQGYLRGNIFHTKKYMSQRVIWALVTGRWPENEIDHKDGNPSNNKFDNLRDATHLENMQNTKISRERQFFANAPIRSAP